MSGVGGILHFDGSQAADAELRLIDSGMKYMGPDGFSHICYGSVGMLFRSFRTIAESNISEQPLSKDGCVIAFDGRLDNRQGLTATLNEPFGRWSDAEIVLLAYRKWKGECVRRIEGDFAFALWDSSRNQLILARDVFGIKPLYYHANRNYVIWASTIEAILRNPYVPLDLDERYIALYLAYDPDGLITPFKAINAVPPGGLCTFNGHHITSRKYYNLSAELKECRYHTDEQYEEQFRALFSESVRGRVRSDGPVMAQLSGGLDSSSIVCVADELMRESEGLCPKLQTLSFVFDRAEQADERHFISEVEKFRNARGFYLREDDDPILSRWPDPDFVSFPNVILCFGGRIQGLLEIMKQANARVLLSGCGGDHLLLSEQSTPFELADLLSRCRIRQLYRRLTEWGLAQHSSIFALFWKAALRPIISGVLAGSVLPPQWMNAEFLKRTHLKTMVREMGRVTNPMRYPSRASRCADLLRLIGSVASGYSNYVTTLGAIEVRYPFLHRPLVEFLLSTPVDQLYRPREPRSLHRRALKGILPELIRCRRDKRGPDQAVSFAINNRWPVLQELVTQSRAGRLGYVDISLLELELERTRHGHSARSQAFLRFVSLEIWLRNLESFSNSRMRGLSEHAA